MLRGILFLIPGLALLAADTPDPWKNVRDLKTGHEVRIITAGAARPIMAQFAELTDDYLVIIVKHEQVALPRDKVSRIDSRPQKGSVSTQTKVSGVNETYSRSQPNASRGPSTSTSTGVAIGDRSEFETIYHRVPPPVRPKK
ncbi:MAG: hypothetical protein ABI759_06440 [Candidatus Solibacter sp.]